MSLKKKIFLSLFLIFVVIQFIQPSRNNEKPTGSDITKVYLMPGNIQSILKESCYDCHSNSTRYPWYTHVQPLGWWMAWHIREGKSELNFDEFAGYSSRRQKSKLKAIYESIEDEAMPLPSYTWLHPSARLTAEKKKILLKWIDEIQITPAHEN